MPAASSSCLVLTKHMPFRRPSKARGKLTFAVGLAKLRSFRLAFVVGPPPRCDFSSASDHLASGIYPLRFEFNLNFLLDNSTPLKYTN